MSRRRAVTTFAVLAVTLAAALLPACGGGDGERLTIYSGRDRELVKPLLDRFAEETGIKIDVRYGASGDLAQLIRSEGDKSPADVFLSQAPGPVAFLEANDLLAELPQELLDQVAPEVRGRTDQWVGLTERIRTLVYNTELVSEDDLPSSVLDLTDPAYEGRVAVAPSNASFQDLVSAMRIDLGDDRTAAWLQGMADNGAQVYANNNAIVQAVGRGEVDMGLINHYYNERAKAEDPSVSSENHFFEADDIGNLGIVSAVGILRTADETDEARQFIDFLLSKSSQEFFAAETFEYPLAAGVTPLPQLPPLDSLGVTRVDFDALGGDFETTQRLIRDSGIDD